MTAFAASFAAVTFSSMITRQFFELMISFVPTASFAIALFVTASAARCSGAIESSAIFVPSTASAAILAVRDRFYQILVVTAFAASLAAVTFPSMITKQVVTRDFGCTNRIIRHSIVCYRVRRKVFCTDRTIGYLRSIDSISCNFSRVRSVSIS